MDDSNRLRVQLYIDTLATIYRANVMEMAVLRTGGAQLSDVISRLECENSEIESKIRKAFHALHRDAAESARRIEADERERKQRRARSDEYNQAVEARREAQREARHLKREKKQQELEARRNARGPLPQFYTHGVRQYESTRWKDWKPSEVELPYLPPITEAEPQDAGLHILADEVDLRARATMTWAPWNRRNRSRRYEGWSRARVSHG